MTRILVAYATVEGQTRKIAQFLADGLVQRRCSAELADLAAGLQPPDPSGFDGVILAAPVHMARHHPAAIDFAARAAAALNAKPSAFVSVSLHAMSGDPEDAEEVAQYMEGFRQATGWRPSLEHSAAGALRYTRYDFFKRWIMRRIAKERGIAADASHDIEYTDWARLSSFLDDFMRCVDGKG